MMKMSQRGTYVLNIETIKSDIIFHKNDKTMIFNGLQIHNYMQMQITLEEMLQTLKHSEVAHIQEYIVSNPPSCTHTETQDFPMLQGPHNLLNN